MDRRNFMKFGGVAAIELGAAKLLMSQAQPGMSAMQPAAAAQETVQSGYHAANCPGYRGALPDAYHQHHRL